MCDSLSKVTIVIAYVRGTSEMMAACLYSIRQHNCDRIAAIYLVTVEGGIDSGLLEVVDCFRGPKLPITVFEVPKENIKEGREHGSLLDHVVRTHVLTEMLLTLDSDCFPIADGWLDELTTRFFRERAMSAGILHPWVPPPPELPPGSIERRVRSQLCWNKTHVACQLVRTEDARQAVISGHGYATGDDTGFGLLEYIQKLPRYEGGARCVGFKPTRCPKPEFQADVEFNRYSCVVYGDKMVHVGGHSRITQCGEDEVGKAVSWAISRILEENGAEFLLEPENSYCYTFEREEEVAKEKFNRMFGLEKDRMEL